MLCRPDGRSAPLQGPPCPSHTYISFLELALAMPLRVLIVEDPVRRLRAVTIGGT